MRRKIITSAFLIIMLVFLRKYIINAAEETPQLGVNGNIDEEKIITINFNATNIRGIQCQLSYDNEVIEYISDSLQGKNNWAVGLNSGTLLFLSGNEENTEKKDIATIQFRTKNETDTIHTNISLSNIKIVKFNGETSTLQDAEIPITIDRNVTSVEESILTEEGKPKDEDGNEIVESQLEGDQAVNYGSDLETNNEEGQTSEPISIQGENEIDQEAEKIQQMEATSGEYENPITEGDNDSNGTEEAQNNQTIVKQIENLASKVLPKTGLARIILPIIVISIILSFIAYKKFKSIKNI